MFANGMPYIVSILCNSLSSSFIIMGRHPFYGMQANSEDPNQMPQLVASYQVHHCLLAE